MCEVRLKESLQWAGTASVLVMYVLMSFYKDLHPWNLVAGIVGSLFFFTWAVLVANRQQIIVNLASIVVCGIGLVRAWG